MNSRAKRILDVVVAAAGVVVTGPLIALGAVAVVLSDGSPAFFKQIRVGRGGRPFTLYKLRTMRSGASGRRLTVGSDPRAFPVGSFLRFTKVDELPQLVNVLRGDMSLVGPRPEVEEYVSEYPDLYASLLTVRPGLTDPASIAYRDESALLARAAEPQEHYIRQILPDKMRISQEYLDHATVASDLRVLLETLVAVVRGSPTPPEPDDTNQTEGRERE